MTSTQQSLVAHSGEAFWSVYHIKSPTSGLNIPVECFAIIFGWFNDALSRINLFYSMVRKKVYQSIDRSIYPHIIHLFQYIVSLTFSFTIWTHSKYLMVGWCSCLEVNLLTVIDSLHLWLQSLSTLGKAWETQDTILCLISAHICQEREWWDNARGNFHLYCLWLHQRIMWIMDHT